MTEPFTVQPRPEYYVLGGALKSTSPSYVERQADGLLLDKIRRREFCYVLTPRQMGKTSLMVRTSSTLRASGIRTVIIDLTQLGTKMTPEQWYLGQLMRVAKDLKLQIDYLGWWRQQGHLGEVQRFITFLTDVALAQVAEPVVIFVDEIDTTLNLSFSDDYFAAIRSLFNQRALDERLDRLTFVLLGVASPSDLIQDAKRTPFNIGSRIPLTDFTETEASVLLPGLAPDPLSADLLLKQILFWTGGHPYLTQKTCREVANWAGSPAWDRGQVPIVVDDITKQLFFSEQGRNQDFNLQFVRDRILESSSSLALLRLYRRIRSGETITDDELDPNRVALKLSGLVVATEGRLLQVRNRIYDRVFDDVWITIEINKRSQEESLASNQKPESASVEYDAFLSYSRRDSRWVQGFLAPKLQKAGLKIFYDSAVLPGQEWGKVLEEGFRRSRCIVLVMSPDYFASEFTRVEWENALRLREEGKRILPLLLKSVDLPYTLARLQFLDFREEQNQGAAMNELLRVLGAPESAPGGNESAPLGLSTYDTGMIRRLLDDAFDADDLSAFVYDYFRPLRSLLDEGATKKARLQRFIEGVEQRGELDRLLDLMARNYPDQYRRYADLVQRLPS